MVKARPVAAHSPGLRAWRALPSERRIRVVDHQLVGGDPFPGQAAPDRLLVPTRVSSTVRPVFGRCRPCMKPPFLLVRKLDACQTMTAADDKLEDEDGLLVIPAADAAISDDLVRTLRDANQR